MANERYLKLNTAHGGLQPGVYSRLDPRIAGLWGYLLRTGVAVETDAPRNKQMAVEDVEALADAAEAEDAPKRKRKGS
jgi:hypothetical protein